MESVEIIYDSLKNELNVNLPLTQSSGKVRVKRRTFFADYGIPVAVRQTKIMCSDYVEWQIGYDFEKNDKSKKSLLNSSFENYKNELKIPYELAEILKFSYDLKFLSNNEIICIYNKIKSYKDYFDAKPIKRTNPIPTKFNELDFYKMTVEYPMFVNKFGNYDIYTEIINKEKQRAVGVQPMLFLCIPISLLKFETNAIGRELNSKECALWNIGSDEAKLSLLLFQMFGMLSEKHNYDVQAIFKCLFKFI